MHSEGNAQTPPSGPERNWSGATDLHNNHYRAEDLVSPPRCRGIVIRLRTIAPRVSRTDHAERARHEPKRAKGYEGCVCVAMVTEPQAVSPRNTTCLTWFRFLRFFFLSYAWRVDRDDHHGRVWRLFRPEPYSVTGISHHDYTARCSLRYRRFGG